MLWLYRETGFRKTLHFVIKATGAPLDCTGCSARGQVREHRGAITPPLVELSTDAPPPTSTASGMAWVDASGGKLRVVIGEDDSKDESKFPRTSAYAFDVVVRDATGAPRIPPVALDLTFTETATET